MRAYATNELLSYTVECRKHMRRHDTGSLRFGVEASARLIVERMQEQGNLRNSQIADLLGVQHGTASPIMKKLQRAGIVTRNRVQDPLNKAVGPRKHKTGIEWVLAPNHEEAFREAKDRKWKFTF